MTGACVWTCDSQIISFLHVSDSIFSWYGSFLLEENLVKLC